MRLFTGLDLPPDVTQTVDSLIARLRPLARIRWSKAANLHVTTKFIGEWPDDRIRELTSALETVPRPGPFEITLDGLGWFPNPHQPRIFWIAVRAPQELLDLAQSTEQSLVSLGIEAERRRYTPHLTLARIEPRGGGPAPDLAALRRAVAGIEPGPLGRFTASAFHLYLSEQTGEGSRYTKLASFPLSETFAKNVCSPNHGCDGHG